MQQYIMRRLTLLLPTLLGVSMLVFGLVRLLPGDAVDQILGDYPTIARDKEELRARLGLDKPVHVQYLLWLRNAARLDLGRSLQSGRPVTEDLGRRLPVSAEVGVIAILTGLIVAVPVGMLAAAKQDTLLDYAVRSVAIGLLATPTFWLGILAITLPALWWGWTPPLLYSSLLDDPGKNLQKVLIPAILLGVGAAGSLMRLTRTAMLETLRHDYVRTAHAKGLRGGTVLRRHALRNALIPIVTVVGLQVPILVGGTVFMEQIFGIPGVGLYFLDGISKRDYPVIQGVNLLVATTVVIANLLVDLSYGLLDPRVRSQA